MLRRVGFLIAALTVLILTATAAKTLDIYFVDVEGGQSTLIVTPNGESLLVDTGFAANGFNDTSNRGRDSRRIVAAARDAGLKRIDYLLTTHFHADHDGGVTDVASQIPIDTFIDHGTVEAEAERGGRGTLEAFAAYAEVRSKARRHIQAQAGDLIPLKGANALIVSSSGKTIGKSVKGNAERNHTCTASPLPAEDIFENPRSTGFVLTFGKFRFLDVGDLSGKPLFDLVCPTDLIGAVDVYLVAHHGGGDAADPATLTAFKPRLAILNNGATKGGAAATFAMLRGRSGMDVWQLHRSLNPGASNFVEDQIANLDETTGHWIKISANADGSFRVTNGRTGFSKNYTKR
jgi:competence protein ComEC